MNTPLLVVGSDGLIGGTLTRHLRAVGERVVTTTLAGSDEPDSLRLDLAAATWPALPAARAAVICAAITSQDQCRRDLAGTRAINVTATLRLIRQLVAADTFVVFISTNLVFDGTRSFCRPDEALSPRTEYGRQKAEVEQALGQWPGQTAVVRLTKVFHPALPLVQQWRQDLSARREIRAFSDYVCSPIHLGTVIAGLARVAQEKRAGIWQLSGPADVTYAALASALATLCGADVALVRAAPAPAHAVEHLPQHTTLDTQRAREDLGLEFPDAHQVLARTLAGAS